MFDALYANNEGYLERGGAMHWLFKVVSGVLQGCPLSGSLFLIVIDPLLDMFSKYIVELGHGHVHACADDVGARLHRIDKLGTVKMI